jgi:hypothetical protein
MHEIGGRVNAMGASVVVVMLVMAGVVNNDE